LTYQVGGEVACADILLATDASTALRAWESKGRARWTVYLVSDYEPARLADGPARRRAIRSYELGLDMLALDPVVADLLAEHSHGNVTLLPVRIGVEPAAFRRPLEPDTVLVVSGDDHDGVPKTAWAETALALERISAGFPDLRIVHQVSAAFAGMGRQTLCVLLCPAGRSPRVHELAASGCPTIVVTMPGRRPCRDAERTRGVIEVSMDALEIARAIESLLVDRVRLGSLTRRALECVRNLPGPDHAARALIEQFRVHCRAPRQACDRDRSSPSDRSLQRPEAPFRMHPIPFLSDKTSTGSRI
jgi:hypothetical protein